MQAVVMSCSCNDKHERPVANVNLHWARHEELALSRFAPNRHGSINMESAQSLGAED